MSVTQPYKSIRCWAMGGTKPYKYPRVWGGVSHAVVRALEVGGDIGSLGGRHLAEELRLALDATVHLQETLWPAQLCGLETCSTTSPAGVRQGSGGRLSIGFCR